MGEVHPGVPQALALGLARRYNCKTFVETGTYEGASTEWARKSGKFNLIYTIEAHHEYYRNAKAKFDPYENVTCLHGDSAKVLPMVLALLRSPALFFLDAHYSGDLSYSRQKAEHICPILEELRLINANTANLHVILVDDARLFGKESDFPGFAEVEALLENDGARRVRVQDDVLVATPRKENDG